MAPSINVSLLGPPEIHHKKTDDIGIDQIVDKFNVLITPPPLGCSPTFISTGNPLLDFYISVVTKPPPMDYTENCSPTFISTGNPCLDFFFHVVPNTPPQTLTQRLELAWKHDPLKTLKLLCNLRGVRGTGKSDKEGGYTAALWLHQNHPKTLASNVASFAEFDYSKDLLEILFQLLEGPDARKLAKEAHQQWKEILAMRKAAKEAPERRKMREEIKKQHGKKLGARLYYTYYGRNNRFTRRRKNKAVESDDETQPKFSREEKRIQRAKSQKRG